MVTFGSCELRYTINEDFTPLNFLKISNFTLYHAWTTPTHSIDSVRSSFSELLSSSNCLNLLFAFLVSILDHKPIGFRHLLPNTLNQACIKQWQRYLSEQSDAVKEILATLPRSGISEPVFYYIPNGFDSY